MLLRTEPAESLFTAGAPQHGLALLRHERRHADCTRGNVELQRAVGRRQQTKAKIQHDTAVTDALELDEKDENNEQDDNDAYRREAAVVARPLPYAVETSGGPPQARIGAVMSFRPMSAISVVQARPDGDGEPTHWFSASSVSSKRPSCTSSSEEMVSERSRWREMAWESASSWSSWSVDAKT